MFKQKLKNVKIQNKYEKKFINKKFRKILILRNKSIKKRLFYFAKKVYISPIFYGVIKLIVIFLLLYVLIIFKKYLKSRKIFFCFCGMARNENLYARELISYYLSIGTGKFIFGDNNHLGEEKLSDVLQDYIKNGTVDIIDLIGQVKNQAEFYGEVYEMYKKKCKWISFFDLDEYLVMHFEEGKNIKVKEFLSNEIYNKCESIEINWVLYNDNDLVYYDKRPSIERFTRPNYKEWSNLFVKSIVRGGLNKTTFRRKGSEHVPHKNLTICNSNGEILQRYNPHGIKPPLHKNAIIMHFNTRTAEEYVNKLNRGFLGEPITMFKKRIKNFFYRNTFTEEKLKLFETRLNMTFPEFHKK